MKRIHAFVIGLFFAIVICSCSINLDQVSTAVPEVETAAGPPAPVSTAAATPGVETTSVPVTWKDLNLTGRLLYLDSNATSDFSRLKILDLGTGEITTLFQSPGGAWIFYMAVSPDNKQAILSYIDFSQNAASSSRALYIMPLEASASPKLVFEPPTDHDFYTQVEWSTEGDSIYYTHYDGNDQSQGSIMSGYDIYRMAYPTGPSVKILDQAFWPRLSPDGTQLVYVSSNQDSGIDALFIAYADGSDPRQVVFSNSGAPGIIDAPLFSPDGQSILFSAPNPAQAYRPNWLDFLTGVKIAKAHNVPSDWWSVPIEGGTVTRLTQIQTIKLFASISPDQKHIASLSGEGIFVMDVDGSNLRQILFDPLVSGTLRWIP